MGENNSVSLNQTEFCGSEILGGISESPSRVNFPLNQVTPEATPESVQIHDYFKEYLDYKTPLNSCFKLTLNYYPMNV